jgi:membrane protein involved in colicin uptake
MKSFLKRKEPKRKLYKPDLFKEKTMNFKMKIINADTINDIQKVQAKLEQIENTPVKPRAITKPRRRKIKFYRML